jgi:D-threo-aldose 1-dehydrogenase
MQASDRLRLGSTRVEVTRLGLGTVPIGGLYSAVEEDAALALVRRTYEIGVRLFDTAPQYGNGLAEERLSEVLPSLPRDEIVVATKVGRLIRPASFQRKARQVIDEAIRNRSLKRLQLGAARLRERARAQRQGDALTDGRRPAGNSPSPVHLDAIYDFSYDGVMTSFEESLRRLRLDRVDVLYVHDPDYYHAQALQGAFKALDQLRSDGLVGAIGVGMNDAEPLARFAREAPFDVFLVAGRYTLLDQSALAELLPECEKRGMGIVIGGTYNSGILANPGPGAYYDYQPAPPAILERAQRMQAVCGRYGVPLMAAAIQFPFGHPSVAAVLTGARSIAELEQNAGALGTPIPDDLWAELKTEGLLSTTAPVPVGGGASAPEPVPS